MNNYTKNKRHWIKVHISRGYLVLAIGFAVQAYSMWQITAELNRLKTFFSLSANYYEKTSQGIDAMVKVLGKGASREIAMHSNKKGKGKTK